MKNVQRTICAILCMLLCVSGCTAEKAAGGKSAASSAQMIDYNKDLARAERNDRYRTTYEIFVYSFCDSNGDGIGDLNGIRSKLDYIGDLGFDALWLTPVHPSSTYHKYDVDDYCAIDPKFGTMEDYEALLRECHERGMRVYLDLVLNHTCGGGLPAFASLRRGAGRFRLQISRLLSFSAGTGGRLCPPRWDRVVLRGEILVGNAGSEP